MLYVAADECFCPHGQNRSSNGIYWECFREREGFQEEIGGIDMWFGYGVSFVLHSVGRGIRDRVKREGRKSVRHMKYVYIKSELEKLWINTIVTSSQTTQINRTGEKLTVVV